MDQGQSQIFMSQEDYDNLLSKLKNTEIERNKLARELRTLSKRQQINLLNLETNVGLTKIISDEKMRQEMYLRLLLRSWSGIIFIFDEDLKFLMGTDSIANIMDVDDISLLRGRGLFSILERYRTPAFTEEIISTIEDVHKSAGDNKGGSLELTVTDTHYKANIQPFFKETEEFAGIMVIMYDITEIVEAKYQAEQASRVKTDFLSSMSHEIRTPMNAIIGMTELALRSVSINEAKEQMGVVKQASAKLLSIINDILDFSKLERNKMTISPHKYQLASLVNDVVSIIRMRAIDLRLCFVVNLASKTPATLIGDEMRIRQVLLNILGNAVKYTQNGFISLAITFEASEGGINLKMDVSDSGQGIKPEDLESIFDAYVQSDYEKNKYVEGTGLGLAITKKIVEAMGGNISVRSEYGTGSNFTVVLPQKVASFEHLASIDSPEILTVLLYERREANTASVLATLRDLGIECDAALSYGQFSNKIVEKEWSMVFIAAGLYESAAALLSKISSNQKIVLLTDFGDALPKKSVSAISMPVHCISIVNMLNGVPDGFIGQADTDTMTLFAAPEAKILIVDDILTNLHVAEGLLKPYSMQVDICEGGLEAIASIQQKTYDLVFMDHRMPRVDGVEATQRIRALGGANSYYQTLPIIALTADAVSGMEEMFLDKGFNAFLSKPIDTKKLNSILKKWVPKHLQQSYRPLLSEPLIQLTQTHGSSEINIQGLDTDRGLIMAGGTVEKYKDTLKLFCRDAHRKVTEIKAVLKNRDIALFTTYVHGMKSASANIGAIELSAQAAELEAAGRANDIERVDSMVPTFLAALETLLGNISVIVNANTNAKEQGLEDNYCNHENLLPWLESLRSAISDMKVGAIDAALEGLETQAMGSIFQRYIEDISEKILTSEFDEALILIEGMIQRLASSAPVQF